MEYLDKFIEDVCAPDVPWTFPIRITRLLLLFFPLPVSAQVQIQFQAYCWEDRYLTDTDTPDAAYTKVSVGDPKDALSIWVPRFDLVDLADDS